MNPTLAVLAGIFLIACGTSNDPSLFDKYFEPYQDLVSGQQANEVNKALLEGMRAYSTKEYSEAIQQLSTYSKKYPDLASPYLYMGISEMAQGNSFKAELLFDHLDNIVPNNFIDQSQWYSALCLLQSGQIDRCKEDLNVIIAKGSHAYHSKAAALLSDLNQNGL